MKRVALVSPYTLPQYCGNSFLADRLHNGLRQYGFDVSVFNAYQNVPPQSLIRSYDLLQVLHAEKTAAWVKQFRRVTSVPWVVTLTGTDYNSWCDSDNPPHQVLNTLSKADALVVFHQEAYDCLQKYVPQFCERPAIIPQGVPGAGCPEAGQALRRRCGIAPGTVVFLMVTSIRPVKNIAASLNAFAALESDLPDALLVLIGPVMDSEEGARILEQGKRLRQFRYLGSQPPSVVRDFMAASQVLLNTSYNEGMPGAVLEAMAEGLPVIASAVSGNRVVVQENSTGLLFSLERQDQLQQAISLLAVDAPLRRRLGEAGRRYVRQHHSLEYEIQSYAALYDRLLPADSPDKQP
ncbi:MAG TPA: glycosyltransferase [Thermodesulfobacteriota bacterium]|nr:glycosyltransferase family 4 protein [Deltaproteobacteria bacterium]HNR11855.1 glycosyltransferase [Thermodesulfobacteriota bacterium]HNU72236.1 glycosyltransferase [Thermodesulfobacteriota bacterium]HOC37829.1 glycosyltransferase [Thermodesulfobacteriota bacterium]